MQLEVGSINKTPDDPAPCGDRVEVADTNLKGGDAAMPAKKKPGKKAAPRKAAKKKAKCCCG